MMEKILTGMLVAGLFFMGIACGSSSSTTDSGTTGDTGEITSLKDVPTSVIDPSQYDVSTNVSLQTALSAKSLGKAAGTSVFSRAGCETDRMKKNIIRNALLPKMILCNMQAMDTASGGAVAGTAGVFNYWRAPDEVVGEGPPGVDSFKPRMAIKKGATDLTFVMCNDTTKVMELFISTANNQYSGHVIDKWGDGFEGSLTFSADGLPTTAAGAVGFTTARFTQQMVEDSAYWSGFGSQTLEAVPTYNTVYGFYNEQGGEGGNNYAGSVHACFDASQGTARYKQDSASSYPAQTLQGMYNSCVTSEGANNCGDFDTDWLGASGWLATSCQLAGVTGATHVCFPDTCTGEEGVPCCPEATAEETCTSAAGDDHQESFTITLADAANHVLNFAVAQTSIYAEAVAAATMPVSSTAPTIEFTSISAEVDCSGSASWASLATIMTAPPDFTACDAMEDEMNDWDTGELCQILDSAASGAEGVQ